MDKKAALLAIIVIVALAIPMASSQVAAQGPYHLTGGVAVGGAPLPGAIILATNVSNPAEVHTSTTNANGFYDLEVPSGIYVISAMLDNYTIIASDGNSSYTRAISSDAQGLDFMATEILGVVTGHVTNETMPLPGAQVVLVMSSTINYSANTSGALGEYIITGARPGTYVAYSAKEGYLTNYSGMPIVVQRGVVTYLNFSLESQPAMVFGQVTLNGNPLEGVKVSLIGGDVDYHSITDSSGNYEVYDVIAGSYTLKFTREGYESLEKEILLSPSDQVKEDAALERELLPGGGGFITGFDLPHSLMVVGFFLAMVTVSAALFIRYRVGKKPDLLPDEEIEKES